MDSLTLIAAAFFVAISIVMLSLSFIPQYQSWAAARLARSVALILTPEVEATVKQRAARQARGATLGGLLGMLIGFALISADPQLARQPYGAFVWLGIILAGNAVGTSVTAALSVTRLPNDTLRYARAEAVELEDYVSPFDRYAARTIVVLATVALLTSIALNANGLVHFTVPFFIIGGMILALLSIAALSLFEIEGRWLVRRGQPAGSPSQLAWDDALRSELLRSLVMAPFALGAYGLILLSFGLGDAAHEAASGSPFIVSPLTIGGYVVGYSGLLCVLLAAALRQQRYFRLRLWPDLAEGL